MKRFYHRVAEINREEGVVGRSRELSWQRLGTPDRMKELKGYIEEAAQCAGTDIEKQRVETWKTGVCAEWHCRSQAHFCRGFMFFRVALVVALVAVA